MFPKYNKISSLSASCRCGHLLLSPAPPEQGWQCLFYIWGGIYSPKLHQLPPTIRLLGRADGCAELGTCSGISGHLLWWPWAQNMWAVAPGSTTAAWSISRASGRLWTNAQRAPRAQEPGAAMLQPGEKGILPWKAELLWGNTAFSPQCCCWWPCGLSLAETKGCTRVGCE